MIQIFTDGSTDPKDQCPNSGLGIAVFDEKGTIIWKGGAPIRTDGNNYVAEVAAAAIVLDASPPHITLQMHVDSMAAINALQKGRLSERRNIRTPARNWVNLAKNAIRQRTAPLEIRHVRSHHETESFEGKGNDHSYSSSSPKLEQKEK